MEAQTVLKYFTLLTMFLLSISAKADLKQLSEEFFQRNFQVYQTEKEIEFSELNLSLDQANRQWMADFSGQYSNDQKDGLTVFSVTGTKANIYSATISKPMIWGGQFQLANKFEKYEGTFFSVPTYGFNQELSYQQSLGANFLGRQSYLYQDVLKNEVEISKLKGGKFSEELFLKFAVAYIDASLAKSLLQLQKEALSRANKRLSLIKKWTRDGLRQKVDLYRAELNQLQAKEQVQQSEMNLLNQLETISTILHRKILPLDVNKLQQDVFSAPIGNFNTNRGNLLAQKEIEVIRKRLRMSRMKFLPKITLSSKYETNAYDDQSSESFSDGALGGETDALSVSLSVNIPVGFESQKVERAQNEIQRMMKEKELEVLQVNFMQTEGNLVKQVEMNKNNIKLAMNRLGIARKSLNEFNRLYSKGKANLENVIRAEEDLINTEITYINYLSGNKKLVFQLATLYGTLKDFLLSRYNEKGEK